MAKASRSGERAAYVCSECGWEAAKWVGRCGECQAWGSVAEAAAPTLRASASPVTAPAVPIGSALIILPMLRNAYYAWRILWQRPS